MKLRQKKRVNFNMGMNNIFVGLVFVTIIFNIAYNADILIGITSPIYSVLIRCLMILALLLWAKNFRKANEADIIVISIIVWELLVMIVNGFFSFEGFYNIITWPCIFAVSYREAKEGRLNQKKLGYILAIMVVTAVLVYQFRTTRLNQIYFSYYSLLVLPFVFETENRRIILISEIITLGLIIFSYKRTGIFIAGVGILVYYLTDIRDSEQLREKGKRVFILLLLLGATWYVFVNYSEGWVVVRRFQRLRYDGGSGRFDIYRKCVEALKSESIVSLLFGNGYKATEKLLNGFAGAHNDFLEILIDYGVVGLICFFFFIGFVVKNTLQARKKKGIRIAPLYSELAMCLVISMVSFLLWQSFLMVPVGLYLGYKLGDIKRRGLKGDIIIDG